MLLLTAGLYVVEKLYLSKINDEIKILVKLFSYQTQQAFKRRYLSFQTPILFFESPGIYKKVSAHA